MTSAKTLVCGAALTRPHHKGLNCEIAALLILMLVAAGHPAQEAEVTVPHPPAIPSVRSNQNARVPPQPEVVARW
ncbi:MAG: hypothetical protein ACRDYA_09360 [Egibacteraceae bacterium]